MIIRVSLNTTFIQQQASDRFTCLDQHVYIVLHHNDDYLSYRIDDCCCSLHYSWGPSQYSTANNVSPQQARPQALDWAGQHSSFCQWSLVVCYTTCFWHHSTVSPSLPFISCSLECGIAITFVRSCSISNLLLPLVGLSVGIRVLGKKLDRVLEQ